MVTFTHIHCSSRFDRSAASLEADMDVWMTKADLITVTEVTNDHRAATLAEQGWKYFNSKIDNGSDNCGITWDTSVWAEQSHHVVRLENIRYWTLTHHISPMVYAITVILKHKQTNHKLMVSCSHMPAHVQGQGHFAGNGGQTDIEWRARKLAYTTAMANWSNTVKNQMTRYKPDHVLCVADWNLDLKEGWVRQYLHDHWDSAGMQLAWQGFSSLGTSIDGGNRVIDGSLYRGMTIAVEPRIMAGVASSDHKPYIESFKLAAGANDPASQPVSGVPADDSSWGRSGSKRGDPWWGFGDYHIDEMFFDPDQDFAIGERGGEVL
jgi:hypothetical protein